jgi:hypothetical protein
MLVPVLRGWAAVTLGHDTSSRVFDGSAGSVGSPEVNARRAGRGRPSHTSIIRCCHLAVTFSW